MNIDIAIAVAGIAIGISNTLCMWMNFLTAQAARQASQHARDAARHAGAAAERAADAAESAKVSSQ